MSATRARSLGVAALLLGAAIACGDSTSPDKRVVPRSLDKVSGDEQSVVRATDAATDWLVGQGYTHVLIEVANEADNGLKNTRGTIAMTRDASRIDSATTQFFINLADAPQRDHTGDTPDTYGYCVFGEVIEGLHVPPLVEGAAPGVLVDDAAQQLRSLGTRGLLEQPVRLGVVAA